MNDEEDEYNDFSYQPEPLEDESEIKSKSIKEINNELKSDEEKEYDDFEKQIEEEIYSSRDKNVNKEKNVKDSYDSAKIDNFIDNILNQNEDNKSIRMKKKMSSQEEIKTVIDNNSHSQINSSSKSVMSKKSLMKGLIGESTENKDNIKINDKDGISAKNEKISPNAEILKKDTNSIQEIKQEQVITSEKEIIDYTVLEKKLSEILAVKSSNVSEYISNNNELFQFFCSLIDTIIPIYEKSTLNPIINDLLSIKTILTKLLNEKSNTVLDKLLYINTEVTNYETMNKQTKHMLSKINVSNIISGKRNMNSLRNLEIKRLQSDFEKTKKQYAKIKEQIKYNKEVISANDIQIEHLSKLLQVSNPSERIVNNKKKEINKELAQLQKDSIDIEKKYKDIIEENEKKIEQLTKEKVILLSKLIEMNKPPIKVEKDIPEFLKETNNNTSKIVNSNSSTNSMKIPNPQSKNTKTKNDFDNLEELEI